MPRKWIAAAIGKPGALHRQLGIPEDQEIPVERLEEATRSDDRKLARRARLALTLRKIAKGER